jgi:hypothetical protein
MKLYLTLIVAALLLTSCATSYRPAPPGTQAITIANVEERKVRAGVRVILPVGDYVPDLATDDGIYYLAPSSVILANPIYQTPGRGGLFVPFPTAKDQRHAVWIQLGSGGGIIISPLSTGSQSTYLYPFDDRVAYSVKQQPNK